MLKLKWIVLSFQNDDKTPMFKHECSFKNRKQAHEFSLKFEEENKGERLCTILKVSRMFVINPMTGGLI